MYNNYVHFYYIFPTVPPPESVTIELGRGAPLYEGTTFSLTCIITPNRTGVDTGFMVIPTFSGPGSPAASDVVMQMDTMDFQTTLSFTSTNPLVLNNSGSYLCSSTVMSQLPNIDMSDAGMAEVVISVMGK